MAGDDFDKFEIERTVEVIRKGSFKRVALQFPDELLQDSADVALLLTQKANSAVLQSNSLDSNSSDSTSSSDSGSSDSSDSSRERVSFYILADTTYGSCCVDEVAAMHVQADLVVHYGRTCLSRTSRIPVLYVFGNHSIDTAHAASTLAPLIRDTTTEPLSSPPAILVMCDTMYYHASSAVADSFRSLGFTHVVTSTIDVQVGVTRGLTAKKENQTESKDFFTYNPETKHAREESASVNRMLMRRYAMVQKAKDADVVGIVVGTLGVVSYLTLINHLKSLILARGKKPYLLAVGKPNPPKLANFLEIDVFVLVACPENTLLDSKEFLRPIVTPFELELALVKGKAWTGAYETDLGLLAPRIGKEAQEELERQAAAAGTLGGSDDDEDDDEPHFSLSTGGYKKSKKYASFNPTSTISSSSANGTVSIRTPSGALSTFTVSSASAEYLNAERSYKGLEVRLGEEPEGGEVKEGRRGVASGYSHEPEKRG
ncbi:Diphthamide biosynthesis protein 2 [Chytridiales sp. JEL 0842]|nr:Diphthamide biosynthesis protein 2 [Chytridiales sp. JEL 0842]